jgi:hypothetical protein
MRAAIAAVPDCAASAETGARTLGRTAAESFFANPTLLPAFLTALAASAQAAVGASGALCGSGGSAAGLQLPPLAAPPAAATTALTAALEPGAAPAGARAHAARAASAVAASAATVATAATVWAQTAAAVAAHAGAVASLFRDHQARLGYTVTLAPALSRAGDGTLLPLPQPFLLTRGSRLCFITLTTHCLRALRATLDTAAPSTSDGAGALLFAQQALRAALTALPRALLSEYTGYTTAAFAAATAPSAAPAAAAFTAEAGNAAALLLTVTHAGVLLHRRAALTAAAAASTAATPAAAAAAADAAAAAAAFDVGKSYSLAASAQDMDGLLALVEYDVGEALLAARHLVGADADAVSATLTAVAVERLEPLLAAYGPALAQKVFSAYDRTPAAVSQLSVHAVEPAAVDAAALRPIAAAALGATTVAAAAFTSGADAAGPAGFDITTLGASRAAAGAGTSTVGAVAVVHVATRRSVLLARLLRVFSLSSYQPRCVRALMPPNHAEWLPQVTALAAAVDAHAGTDASGYNDIDDEDDDSGAESRALVLAGGDGSARRQPRRWRSAKGPRRGAARRPLRDVSSAAQQYAQLLQSFLRRLAPAGAGAGSARQLLWMQQTVNTHATAAAAAAAGAEADAAAAAADAAAQRHWLSVAKLGRLAALADGASPAAAAAATESADRALLVLTLRERLAADGYPAVEAPAGAAASVPASAAALVASCAGAAAQALEYGAEGYDALRLAVWRGVLCAVLAAAPAAAGDSAPAGAEIAAAEAAVAEPLRALLQTAVAADGEAWRALAAQRRDSVSWVRDGAAAGAQTQLFVHQLAGAVATIGAGAAGAGVADTASTAGVGAGKVLGCAYPFMHCDIVPWSAVPRAVDAVTAAWGAAVAELGAEWPAEVKPLCRAAWAAGASQVKSVVE